MRLRSDRLRARAEHVLCVEVYRGTDRHGSGYTAPYDNVATCRGQRRKVRGRKRACSTRLIHDFIWQTYAP